MFLSPYDIHTSTNLVNKWGSCTRVWEREFRILLHYYLFVFRKSYSSKVWAENEAHLAARRPNDSITVNSQRTHIRGRGVDSAVHAPSPPGTRVNVCKCMRPAAPSASNAHNIATLNGIWLARHTFSAKVDILQALCIHDSRIWI